MEKVLEIVLNGMSMGSMRELERMKMLKENGDKLPAEDKSKIEAALNDVKEALKGNDAAAMKTATEALNTAWQSVSEQLYKAAQQQAPAGEQATGQASAETKDEKASGKSGKDEGTIIDAEVVDDNK